jgi:hypothetical protein
MTLSKSELKKIKPSQLAHKQEIKELAPEILNTKRKSELQQEFKKKER